MPTRITYSTLRGYLATGRFDDLLIDELGWDTPELSGPVPVSIPAGKAADAEGQDERYVLRPVAGKRSVHFFSCDTGDAMLTKEQRRKIERQLDKHAHEHLIIFHTDNYQHQVWQVPQREPGKPIRLREFDYIANQANNALVDFVDKLHFSLRDEANLTLLDVMSRLQSGVAADKVTNDFYKDFSKQKTKFIGLIKGIADDNDRGWYAAIMLNRLMFSWFLQSKGFLNNEDNYLPNKLKEAKEGKLPVPDFQSFYETFLHALFHDGFNAPLSDRSPETKKMLGKIPYINGGIFERHRLERENPGIQIPDSAFEEIFTLFGKYRWHLDDRPVAEENEINPDVLGHIFEKFVNQKEKGAYYTKEDVTGYISQNTIIPWLLDRAKKDARIAFDHTTPGSVWDLLKEQPERYIYPSMRHGVIDDEDKVLPQADEIAAGEDDVSQRGNWNERATAPYNLPTETWREYFHRRNRTIELRQKLANGEIREIDDLITYNLDIRQFMQDIIERAGGIELVKALWKAVSTITILDPTVGSGAFLFAAVRVLEPIANGLLERMEGFVEAKPQHHPHSNEAEFARILAERNAHPNQNYYVMRQIILNNLYGVDIEEEAVEICKLRLFLLLAAQIERGEKIEPLPDIDFNIRPGNTLVGYASASEVSISSTGQKSMDLEGDVRKIDEEARLADQAFQHFKMVQTNDATTREDLYKAKQTYREKLNVLRAKLDRYLYKQQGARDSFESWKGRTQSFHWFMEFHHVVIGNDGFSVILGNPPYVSARTVRAQYSIQGYATDRATDIYAMVLERSTKLLSSSGGFGMIVPLSLTFSGDFDSLRRLIAKNYSETWFSSFARIPAALFSSDVRVRNTIFLGRKTEGGTRSHSTRLHRWKEEARYTLFHTLQYSSFDWGCFNWRIPRYNDSRLLALMARLTSQSKNTVAGLLSRRGAFALTYRTSAYNWLSFTPEEPVTYDSTGNITTSSGYATIETDSQEKYALLLLGMNGQIAYLQWCAFGDDLNVTKSLTGVIPSPTSINDEQISNLKSIANEFIRRLPETVNFKLNAGKKIGRYDLHKLRSLTDQSDQILAQELGFQEEMWEQVLLHNAQMIKTDFDSDASDG